MRKLSFLPMLEPLFVSGYGQFHPNAKVPATNPEAVHYWLDFGLNVIPIDPGKKSPAVKWKQWLDALNNKSITTHWQKYPDHELGAIVDDRLFILDADSKQAMAALYDIEKAFDITPNLIVSTSKGEHHYFRRAAGTHAHMASFSTEREPEKIDVRTGRGGNEGRSVIVLPPSANKTIKLNEAESVNDLTEVDQIFIDAIFKHNGKEAPRPKPKRERNQGGRITSTSEAAEILEYISADLGYDDWLKVLMGLHDKFQGSDEGLYLADEWSSQGEDYPGFEEIKYKWGSFTANKTGGVTFSTVAKMAETAGADLKEIASHYDKNGNRYKTYEEVLEEAEGLTQETPSDIVEALVKQTQRFTEIERRRSLEAIKKTSKIPINILKKVSEENTRSESAGDELALAHSVIDVLGIENVLNAQSFTWAWHDSGVWKKMEDRSTLKAVQHHIPKEVSAVNNQLVNAVSNLFKTEIFRPDHKFDQGDAETVNCLNGELSLNDSYKWVLHPHCREHYRTTQIPITYDPDASAPRFTQFMREVFKGDDDAEDKKVALLEMIGYTLMAHCRHERFVILVGSGANGKSVLLSVIEALCGQENVAGVQPSTFDRSFHRAHLHGKLVNIVTEIKQGEVIDDASLKGIVSGEPTTVEHKFKDPFVMRPFSTCWFGTNHMPHTRDFSDALFRRALVVPFNQVFKPEMSNCDTGLRDKLLRELPGILNLALQAYGSALKYNFMLPQSCIDARNDWRLEADQVAQFVEEECDKDPDGEVPIGGLYSKYRDWALDSGISRSVTKKSFRNRLTSLGFGASRTGNTRWVTGLKYKRDYNETCDKGKWWK